MKTKHTKGEWTVEESDPFEIGTRLIASGDTEIAHIETWSNSGIEAAEEAKANAKLIAASPELLDTLMELSDLMQGVIDGDYIPNSFTLQPARLIIKKATE